MSKCKVNGHFSTEIMSDRDNSRLAVSTVIQTLSVILINEETRRMPIVHRCLLLVYLKIGIYSVSQVIESPFSYHMHVCSSYQFLNQF